MQRAELRALTSLRGIAAMAVVLQHFSATAALLTVAWVPSLVPHGYMAVDFFFVLSGFIMAYNYAPAFEARGMRAYRPFLYKRVARIFPLGIAVTAIVLFCGALASLWHRADLFIAPITLEGDLTLATLVNLAHLQGFFPQYNFNSPSWSVSLELGAYLLFPVLIRLFLGRPRWAAALATSASVAVLVLLDRYAPKSVSDRAISWDVARCLAEFGLGLVVYRAYRFAPFRALGRDRWTIAIAAVTVLSGLLRLDLLTALSFPALVLAFALNRGRAARLLASPLPHFLGLISFSVYLTHNMLRAPAAAALTYLHPAPLTPTEALLFAAGFSLLVLPLAALSYHFIEKPGRTALNRFVTAAKSTRLRPVPAD
jgi:peptidoglycan/LPS O-acetylase OafA/YrhL